MTAFVRVQLILHWWYNGGISWHNTCTPGALWLQRSWHIVGALVACSGRRLSRTKAVSRPKAVVQGSSVATRAQLSRQHAAACWVCEVGSFCCGYRRSGCGGLCGRPVAGLCPAELWVGCVAAMRVLLARLACVRLHAVLLTGLPGLLFVRRVRARAAWARWGHRGWCEARVRSVGRVFAGDCVCAGSM